jgi:hypothetical protein
MLFFIIFQNDIILIYLQFTDSSTMSKTHTDFLTSNRTYLIDNIGNPIEVLDKLYEKGIFTRAMKEVIEVGFNDRPVGSF